MTFILGFTLSVNAQPAQPSTPQSSGWNINNDSVFGDKISMVSATDGWIITFAGKSAFLYRWDGTNWTNAGSVAHTQDIVRGDISMVSAADGWIALGGPLGGGAESVIYHWVGYSWTQFDTVTDPNEVSFSSLDMISATDGWAAAGFKFGSKYYHWNGITWELDTNVWLPLVADDDIDMVSANDGWAVGFTGKITRWDGSAWIEVTSPVTTSLNSVSMVSATNGWAVGDDGVILHWDGSTWTQANSPTIAELNAVTMVSATDGWIAGYGGTLRYEVVPSLAINFATGAPGSYFTFTGIDFPANDTATITVNGQELGNVPTNTNGEFVFLFSTTNADEGAYFVTANVNPSATTRFTLDSNEPVRPQDGTGTVFEVPAGIAFTETIYLPLVLR